MTSIAVLGPGAIGCTAPRLADTERGLGLNSMLADRLDRRHGIATPVHDLVATLLAAAILG